MDEPKTFGCRFANTEKCADSCFKCELFHSDYISREAAFESLEKIKSYLHQPCPEYSTMMFWEVEDFIDTLPSADVRPVVRGRWMPTRKYDYCYKCSVCNKSGPLEPDGESAFKYNFCPNCGADMRPR